MAANMLKTVLFCVCVFGLVFGAPNPSYYESYPSISVVKPFSYSYYRPYSYWPYWYNYPWYAKYYSSYW